MLQPGCCNGNGRQWHHQRIAVAKMTISLPKNPMHRGIMTVQYMLPTTVQTTSYNDAGKVAFKDLTFFSQSIGFSSTVAWELWPRKVTEGRIVHSFWRQVTKMSHILFEGKKSSFSPLSYIKLKGTYGNPGNRARM